MRECPKCHVEKADASFFGNMCGDCHARGRDMEPVSGKTSTAQKSFACQHCGKLFKVQGWQKKHEAECPRRRGAAAKETPARASKGKAHYRRCPHCGQPKSNVSEHAKRCKKNPACAGAALKSHTLPAQAKGCVFCAGQSSALAKDLFARMLRGGMTFDSAVDIVRDVVGVVAERR